MLRIRPTKEMLRQTTTMMFEKRKESFFMNGSNRLTESRYEEEREPAMSARRIRLNEWTFSLSLLALSLSIVLGKLYVNYGGLLSSQTGGRYSTSTFTQMHGRTPSVSYLPKFDMRKLSADSERFANASNGYAGAAAVILVTFYEQCRWFLQAIMCGFLITSFTWFIIYKDSRIPGVNPPTPFSPSRQRIYGYVEQRRIHINYLVGIFNGILFFIYMCL